MNRPPRLTRKAVPRPGKPHFAFLDIAGEQTIRLDGGNGTRGFTMYGRRDGSSLVKQMQGMWAHAIREGYLEEPT